MPQYSNDDFRDLIKCMRDVFAYITNLKQERSIAVEIQKPRIPSSFSENLALFLLREHELILDTEFRSIELDRIKADIIALDDAGREVKIEVKATGRNNFQFFGDKDVKSDYIIWVDFGDMFENENTTTVDIYTIKPKLDGLQSQKLDLNRLRRLIKNQPLQKQSIDLRKYNLC